MEGPKVTWLLPVRNGMPFLPDTLASLEAQTYKNFEVLAWDNASTDGTLEEFQKWIPSRLPGTIVTGNPLTLGDSLKEMVKQAETDICARIDADDIALPQRLEKQIAYLQGHPEVAVVSCQYNELDEHGRNYGQTFPLPVEHEDILHGLLHFCPIVHPGSTFRRQAVLEAGNYRFVGKLNAEDYDLWLRVAEKHRFYNMPDILINYRIHSKSVTRIAIAGDYLVTESNKIFARNANLAFGLSEEEALSLREKRHPDTLGALQRIVAFWDKHQQKPADHFASDSFLKAAKTYIPDGDNETYIRLMKLGKRYDLLRSEWGSRGKALLKRAGVHNMVRPFRAKPAPPAPDQGRRAWQDSNGVNRGVRFDGDMHVDGPGEAYHWVHMGIDSRIGRGVTLLIPDTNSNEPLVVIGDFSVIGANALFEAKGVIALGESVKIGPFTHLIALPDQKVSIGANAVIESHCVIKPGSVVGAGARLLAGSVLEGEMADGETWRGNPAQKVNG